MFGDSILGAEQLRTHAGLARHPFWRNIMRMLVLVLLVLLLLGALPTWPYSTGWGYYPSGGGLLILIIVAVLLLRRA
jgi:uncharacterized membrane protein